MNRLIIVVALLKGHLSVKYIKWSLHAIKNLNIKDPSIATRSYWIKGYFLRCYFIIAPFLKASLLTQPKYALFAPCKMDIENGSLELLLLTEYVLIALKKGAVPAPLISLSNLYCCQK